MNKKTIITALLALVTLTALGQENIWNNVTMGYANAPIIKVSRVAMYADRTDVNLRIDYRKGQRMGFSKGTALKADGKEYKVTGATVIKLDEIYTMTADTLSLTLTFEPLPMTTQRFDVVSNDGLQLLNIRNANSLPEGITNTYWRNETTGDWLIGITQNHVIYGNKVWDIVNQTAKKDAYTLTINNGTVIKVGKMKKGQRVITFGKEKAVKCSPITTATLPDYPTKDQRKGFVDNGYREADSVTIIGWLKDMPEQEWKRGKEFNVAIGNILSDEEEENSYAKMDSLGRFTLKMPILNSSEAFLDWGRTSKSTLLEPGKTYFLLYDFTTGQKLWMGDDVRLQNELLAYPHDWNSDHITDNEEGKITAMQFKARTDSTRAASMTKLQDCLTQHPNLSQRYIDYLTGYYQTNQGFSMMQARYRFPDLPKEYMDYVSQELWQKANKPYTLYRDFGTFMRDYIDHITTVDNTIRVGNHGITLGDANNAFFLRCKLAEGKVTLSDEDLADLDRFVAANIEFRTSEIQKNVAAGAKNIFDIDSVAFQKFAQQDFVQHFFDIMAREDIKKVMQEEWPLINLYAIKRVLDASGADQSLHDIALARKLFWQIDSYRKSLEPVMMTYAEKEIKTPAVFNYVKAANDKYLALERQDFANAASLRPSSDVEGMSDGEKIFRKILEPFKGRIVYLDVWGTWCGPCKRNLKESWKVKEQLKNYDIVYLYLCNRSSDEAWKNVIKEYNLTGENCVHYNLPEEQQSAVENYLNIHSYPTYKLIDKQGNIHDLHWLHHEDMKSFLETIDKLSK